MTQEQIDRAVDFIKSLHNMAFEDDVIMNIIDERLISSKAYHTLLIML